MGLLDSLTQQAGNIGHEAILNQVLSMFGGGGSASSGLIGLVNAFRQNGQGAAADSWIGTGHNLPISPEVVQQVLGNDKVQQLAERFHISPETVKSLVAQHLPAAVDKMTPDGQLPQQ